MIVLLYKPSYRLVRVVASVVIVGRIFVSKPMVYPGKLLCCELAEQDLVIFYFVPPII